MSECIHCNVCYMIKGIDPVYACNDECQYYRDGTDPVKDQMLEALRLADRYIGNGIVDPDKVESVMDIITQAIEAAEKEIN